MKQKYFCAFFYTLISTSNLFSATLSDYVTVLSMCMKNPAEMGEIAPISGLVGQELVRSVRLHKNSGDEGKFYLEAGGGTGVISLHIVQNLRSCDHLDIVEINPQLCKILEKRFKNYDNVSVRCCSILDWDPDYKYDAIISTLPFLSLGIDFAKKTMSSFKGVAAKGCMLSCVEYPIVVALRNGAQKLSLVGPASTAVQRYMASIRKKNLQGSKTIYYNIPAINVYHMCFDV